MLIYFNPRSLTGATVSLRNFRLFYRFQSTLPHGSDFTFCFKFITFKISIHAPSRERPYPSDSLNTGRRISIHAPSRERPMKMYCIYDKKGISIHAPSRERQIQYIFIITTPFNFNPRSLTGATCHSQDVS